MSPTAAWTGSSRGPSCRRIDYLLAAHLGADTELAFVRDLAESRFVVEPVVESDLPRAYELCGRYGASAIATMDLRHFAVMEIRGTPELLPRDL